MLQNELFADIPIGFGMLSFLPGCSLEFLVGKKWRKRYLLIIPTSPKNQNAHIPHFVCNLTPKLHLSFLPLGSLCLHLGHPLLDIFYLIVFCVVSEVSPLIHSKSPTTWKFRTWSRSQADPYVCINLFLISLLFHFKL